MHQSRTSFHDVTGEEAVSAAKLTDSRVTSIRVGAVDFYAPNRQALVTLFKRAVKELKALDD